jgi:hypothetical protein
MDSRRSKKSRSIPVEPKSARPAPASARLPVVDRTRADPAVARGRASQSQPHVQVQTQREDARGSDMRILDGVDRDSQVSVRDDPFCRTYQSPHWARLAAESRIVHGASKRKDDVCSPLKAGHNSPDLPTWHHACYPAIYMLTV